MCTCMHILHFYDCMMLAFYLWARCSEPICRDSPILKWWLQSMYFHGNIIAREHMLAYKSTQSSLLSLPQSAVVIVPCSNYFKVTNLRLRQSKVSPSSFSQPSAITRIVLRSKQPPKARKFSWDGQFGLRFERDCDLASVHVLGQDAPHNNYNFYNDFFQKSEMWGIRGG